jgi:hypothetical protein
VAHWPTVKAGFRQEICFLARTLRARRQYSPSKQAAKDDLESVLAALFETGSAEARAELLVQQASFAAATQRTLLPPSRQPTRHEQPGYTAERRLVPCCRAY